MDHAKGYKEEFLNHIFVNRYTWLFEVVSDRELLDNYDDYLFVLSVFNGEECNPDNLDDNEGIEGVLLPSGGYCYIPYNNHNRFVNAIIDDFPEELQNNIVFLFSGVRSKISALKDLTLEQWEWLSKYENKLSDGQRDSLNELNIRLKKGLMPNLKDALKVHDLEFFRYGLVQLED